MVSLCLLFITLLLIRCALLFYLKKQLFINYNIQQLHQQIYIIVCTQVAILHRMQQVKVQQKKPIYTLWETIKKHIQSLHKLNDDLMGKPYHQNYPAKSIISFYQKQLLPKLQARMNNNKSKSYVFSDIIIWHAHRLLGFVFLVESHIKKLDSASMIKQSLPINRAGSIQISHTVSATQSFGSLTNISNQSNQQIANIQTLLRVPQVFLSKNLVTIIRAAMAYAMQQEDNIQSNSLNLFLTVYEGFIQRIKNPSQNKPIADSVQKLSEQVKLAFYSDIPNPKSRTALKFAYRFLYIAKLRLRTKKANSRLNQRKQRIKQLVYGQLKYAQGLKDYIQYIKKPIQATGIINKEQQRILFSTIESILSLHTHFQKQLKQHFDHYQKYQTYGNLLAKNFPYFKIYTDYIYYADQAQALLLQLESEHVPIKEICKKFMKEKQKKASDELKQPTFRIARYQMIIKQLIKNTNPIHPDYEKLNDALKVGISMLKKINENVDFTCRRNKLNQLQQEFGTQQRPIYTQKREFLEQFQMIYIHEQKQQPVIVYVFTNVVIIIHSSLRKLLKWIQIDDNFYVRKEEDNKTYKNIIKIHSDGYTTLSTGLEDKQIFENKAEQIFNLLRRVSKQNQENSKIIYVQVIGTQEIGSTSFAKHTQYIVQIKYLGLRKFVYLRFSQVQPLVNKAQQYYHNDLNIREQQALKKNWFNNHKSKTIQDRKRTIQQILQKILNHQIVRRDPSFILQQLKLQKNFIKKTQEYRKKKAYFDRNNVQQFNSLDKQKQVQKQNGIKISGLHHAQTLDVSKINTSVMKTKKKQSKQAQTILCATQIKLGRDMYHDNDDMFLDTKKTEAEKIQIKIHTTVEEEPCSVLITQFYTVEDVCHKVSKIIGLRMNRDFRLFHEIGKKQLRALDQQQKLMDLFNFPRYQMNGVVSDFIDSVKKIVAPSSHPRLVFKKYYFLPIDIQQSQCRRDLTRLRLIVYQIFSEIKDMKYQLGFDEYLLFLAMLIYIEFDGEPPQKIPDNFVDRIIPQTIFKLKNYTEQQWIQKCRSHLSRLSQEIENIISYNRDKLKQNKIKNDSVSKTALHFGHRHLCSQIVINKIKSNPIFGSNLFYVQPYKNTFQKLLNQGLKMAYNMWLAIKVEGLSLLTPSSKEPVLQLEYKNIQKIFVYSESITFKMESISTLQYRFNTYQSFEISQLVKYNKCLNDTLLELEGSQDLIMKARTYKQESLIYRNTYDRSQKKIQNIK